MNALYNITNNFMEIIENFENGEYTEQEYNKLMSRVCEDLQNKSTNIIAIIRNNEILANSIKMEERRLKENREKIEKGLEKLKTYVKENMEKLTINRIETEIGTMSIRRNPLSIEIEDETIIPEEFKKIKTEITIDKTSIKNYFKETGEIIEGTRIVNNKTSLVIK